MSAARRAFWLALALSVMFASAILWIALRENSQQEFYGSELGIAWWDIFSLWFMSFALAFAGPALVLIAVKLAQIAKRRLGERPAR